MRSMLLILIVAASLALLANATPLPRRENALSTIEWSVSPSSGEVGLHLYVARPGGNGNPRAALYTFEPETTVEVLAQSTLTEDLSASHCSLRDADSTSSRRIAHSTLLADALRSHPQLELVCSTPSSRKTVWKFVEFTKEPRYPNKEALAHSLRATPAPYPQESSALMGNNWQGVLGWVEAFLEHHWGDLHPYPNYTTSATQTGRWHLNTGKVLTDFHFGSESTAPATIGIAADWGAGTMESAYVAACMMNSTKEGLDWTIHVGDVYYVGSSDEIKANCLGIAPPGVEQGVLWPHGNIGSFAVQGNHEMYARGYGFFDTFLPSLGVTNGSGGVSGQDAGYASLENLYWRVIMLDTGYNTYSLDPFHDATNNTLPGSIIDWLRDVVNLGNETDTRGIIFLTHHQVHSAFQSEFLASPQQIAELLPPNRTVLWLWGHEHRVSWYDPFYLVNATKPLRMYGRCIGNSGFPGEMAPIPPNARQSGLRAYDDRLYRYESGFSNASVSFNGFVTMELRKNVVTLAYSSLEVDPQTGRLSPWMISPLVSESFEADSQTGNVNLIDFTVLNKDITIVSPGVKKGEGREEEYITNK